MTLNQKALKALEKNNYKKAALLFHKAVQECRDVQSLNNLAWMIWTDDEEADDALSLLEEAVAFEPVSHFPYSLMGEIYTKTEQWQRAQDILVKALAIKASTESYNNLAVALYHLGNAEKAADYFLLAAEEEKSGYILYSHAKCLIELGRTDEALQVLDTFSEEDGDFVGTVDLGDLYVEAGDYGQAVRWFAKGWDDYAKDPNWIERYVYAFFKMERFADGQGIINQALDLIKQESNELRDPNDYETWSEAEKQEELEKLLLHQQAYEQLWSRLLKGYVPAMDFEPGYLPSCYLFGCERHHHPEYKEL